MSDYFSKEIDIAECGGIKPLQTIDTESTLAGTPNPSPTIDYEDQEPTGRTGCARFKQSSKEMRFFPACERQLFMVLDYQAAKLWDTQQKLEQLELQNRLARHGDYKEHRPENDYGKQKEMLMKGLTEDLNTFYNIFNNANGVLSQLPPNVQYVNEYRLWASYNLSPDPADEHHAADNYRFIGPRPSSIDASLHSFLKFTSRFTRRRGGEGGIHMVEHSDTLFRAIYHVVIISFALVFLLLPLTLTYFIDMTKVMAVVMMTAFCLCFCLVLFLFASASYDHKLVLFFAYTSVIATLLSNIGNGYCAVVPG